MGAVAPIPPRARNAAAPDGAPPRRIKGEFSESHVHDLEKTCGLVHKMLIPSGLSVYRIFQGI